jgi:hypothetical protein
MHLVPCQPPTEPLDAAPRTDLLRDADAGAQWEGFWSDTTDAYYARRTTGDGDIAWFRIADDQGAESAPLPPATSRVLAFRGGAMRRVQLIVAESPSGRPMLVGTARRGLRS